jgi:hypothetical protein
MEQQMRSLSPLEFAAYLAGNAASVAAWSAPLEGARMTWWRA